MALILCPECGRPVSDIAIACPHCGFPISNKVAPMTSNENNVLNKESFPSFPTVMNIGEQLSIFSGDCVMFANYKSEINHTQYIKEGQVSISTHTNGISVSNANLSNTGDIVKPESFNISYEQIIDMSFIRYNELNKVIGNAEYNKPGSGSIVIGETSGVKKEINNGGYGEYIFLITFWDVYTRKIQTIFMYTHKELTNFIKCVNKIKSERNIPTGSNYICNILNDENQFNEEKIIEALKLVGERKLCNAFEFIEGCDILTAKEMLQKITSKHGIDAKLYESRREANHVNNLSVLIVVTTIVIFFVIIFRSCDSGSDSSLEECGKYTSPSGKRQIQYQGSREQQRDLDLIDSYFGY